MQITLDLSKHDPRVLKLIASACWDWNDCEAGAPTVDPKRPYGNSNVAYDIAEILGAEVDPDEGLTDEQEEEFMGLHRQTMDVMEDIVRQIKRAT